MLIEGKQFLKAGTTAALDQGGALHLRIMGRPVSIFRDPSGSIFSTEMSCKHQGASLAAGKFAGTVVTCARHGWKYDILTGACLNADSPSLRRHRVHVEDGVIYVAFYPDER